MPLSQMIINDDDSNTKASPCPFTAARQFCGDDEEKQQKHGGSPPLESIVIVQVPTPNNDRAAALRDAEEDSPSTQALQQNPIMATAALLNEYSHLLQEDDLEATPASTDGQDDDDWSQDGLLSVGYSVGTVDTAASPPRQVMDYDVSASFGNLQVAKKTKKKKKELSYYQAQVRAKKQKKKEFLKSVVADLPWNKDEEAQESSMDEEVDATMSTASSQSSWTELWDEHSLPRPTEGADCSVVDGTHEKTTSTSAATTGARESAATLIQTTYRRVCAKARVANRKKAILLIQSFSRTVNSRHQLVRIQSAILLIQSFCRMSLVRSRHHAQRQSRNNLKARQGKQKQKSFNLRMRVCLSLAFVAIAVAAMTPVAVSSFGRQEHETGLLFASEDFGNNNGHPLYLNTMRWRRLNRKLMFGWTFQFEKRQSRPKNNGNVR